MYGIRRSEKKETIKSLDSGDAYLNDFIKSYFIINN